MTANEIKNTDNLLKTKNSYLIIQLDYSSHFVLSHTQGMKLIDSLNGAEKYIADYGKPTTITYIDKSDYPRFFHLSQENYLEYKMNALLKVDTNPKTAEL
jgi:hypothetical protein